MLRAGWPNPHSETAARSFHLQFINPIHVDEHKPADATIQVCLPRTFDLTMPDMFKYSADIVPDCVHGSQPFLQVNRWELLTSPLRCLTKGARTVLQ